MIPRLSGVLALLLAASAVLAQAPVTPPQPPDPLAEFLFPPELVMGHQRELGLSPDQRTAITEAIKGFQAAVVDLQWQMQDEQAKLAELLRRPAADEKAVLAQTDRVLEVERQVKRAHLSLLIRIKNSLTPDQQARLRAARGPARGPGG